MYSRICYVSMFSWIMWAGLCAAYNPECVHRCGTDNVVVESVESDGHCSITMPDNPYRRGDINDGDILPCQIEIHANCSNYCHVELMFDKFDLTPCYHNLNTSNGTCEIVDSCEYVMSLEQGVSLDGASLSYSNHFHGNYTNERFESATDRILLQFCYRSETFSARNIQITYGVIDPSRPAIYYTAPLPVYILSALAVLLAMAICAIGWCPCVKECLEPSTESKTTAEEFL